MTIGLVGKKVGMTRLFLEDGKSVPVTVVHIEPNYIAQVKTQEVDGYDAVQVTTGKAKQTRVSKAEAGHFSKANVVAGKILWEFPLSINQNNDFTLGQAVTVEIFNDKEYVDVTGTTKGKGYAGVIKRHNFATQDATHGNSVSHRAPGSIGQRQTPGRVFKGKRMAGHLGNARRTIQNLQVVRVDKERNLLLIKGALPGAPGNFVIVKPSIKMGQGLGETNAA